VAYEIPEFEVVEARYSRMALMPRLFAYIDYRSLGVHEPPRARNTELVYNSMTDIGYRGPAISTFFALSDDWMDDVEPFSVLEDMPYGVVGVADGHNRLETFRLLDGERRLRSPIIPVQLVPAHNPWLIHLYDDEKPHPEELRSACGYCVGRLALIDECHMDPERVIENNTTYYAARLDDGASSRIRSA
jgi:hypothetical protein